MLSDSSKLLLIAPSFFFVEDYHRDLFNHRIPLNLLQLASLLQYKFKMKSQMIDLRYEKEMDMVNSSRVIDKDVFRKRLLKILEENYIQEIQNILIILDSSYEYFQSILIAEILKKEFPKTKIIIGGHHPNAVPNDYIYKNSPFDYVVSGELENNCVELFKSKQLKNASNHNQPELLNSPNYYDLNDLPFPDYDSFLKKYDFKDFFNFEINSSRGCPFDCRFCKIAKHAVQNYSFGTFQKHFEELQKVILSQETNLKIAFSDQTFNSASNSKKILEHIINKHLQENFTFSCQSRIEIVHKNSELINLFQKARMIVGFGFETANTLLLKEMNKTKVPDKYVQKMKDIINIYKNINGIYCRINVIVGFPGETEETFLETISFINEHAINENIQISPTIFQNDPITYVYRNMKYYEEKFETQFNKEWWKIPSDPLINAILIKPSKNYSKKQLIQDYIGYFYPILTKFKYKPFKELINWKAYYKKSLSEL